MCGGGVCVVATHPLPLLRTHNQSRKDDVYSSFSGCLQAANLLKALTHSTTKTLASNKAVGSWSASSG